ncbi:hypothetical protein RhiJN_06331 [Ceratobasidium sp. AG-Ba]|nr:hypothetical protein RhiJN_06331 [Ceratobasidium sp. AG-Ba]
MPGAECQTPSTDAPPHRHTATPTLHHTDTPPHQRSDIPPHRRSDAPTPRRTPIPTPSTPERLTLAHSLFFPRSHRSPRSTLPLLFKLPVVTGISYGLGHVFYIDVGAMPNNGMFDAEDGGAGAIQDALQMMNLVVDLGIQDLEEEIDDAEEDEEDFYDLHMLNQVGDPLGYKNLDNHVQAVLHYILQEGGHIKSQHALMKPIGFLARCSGRTNGSIEHIVSWPDAAPKQEIQDAIGEKIGIEGVVGIVDVTHTNLTHKPPVDGLAYQDRKKNVSVLSTFNLQATSPSQSPLETGAFDVLLARRAEDYTPKTKRLDTLHRAVVDASTLDYIYEQPQEAATHQAKIRRRRRRIQNRK